MADGGPYTTVTVEEYSRMTAVIRHLRKRVQTMRELLEQNKVVEALAIAKFEDDHL